MLGFGVATARLLAAAVLLFHFIAQSRWSAWFLLRLLQPSCFFFFFLIKNDGRLTHSFVLSFVSMVEWMYGKYMWIMDGCDCDCDCKKSLLFRLFQILCWMKSKYLSCYSAVVVLMLCLLPKFRLHLQ